jgi:hypothetical protein
MKSFISTVALVAGLASFGGLAHAQTIDNNQRNNANIRSQLNATISDVTGDVSATAASIGNSFTAEGSRLATLNNYQNFWGDATSALSTSINNVTGDVSATSAAIANSASVNVDWATNINNTQYANYDPTSTLNGTITNVVGDVSETSAALSNSASIDAAFSRVASTQMNGAGVNASMSTTVRNVRGAVTATAAA